tara:strand:- start:805 stop:1473 length:669 start_codon:yes stop_codon:yes gene_type:complete
MKQALLMSSVAAFALLLSGCQQNAPEGEEATIDTPSKQTTYSASNPDRILSNDELNAHADEARAAAMQLGQELKAELIAAMEAGGPMAAISVCAEMAPAIASRISDETGMEVGRTSLKTRNSANAPDAWEVESMERFLTSSANGYSLTDIERFYALEEEGETVFRFMKPIVMQEMCVMCHGDAVSDDVMEAVRAAYPQDQATGFAPGDLRGAFTVTKTLDLN